MCVSVSKSVQFDFGLLFFKREKEYEVGQYGGLNIIGPHKVIGHGTIRKCVALLE